MKTYKEDIIDGVLEKMAEYGISPKLAKTIVQMSLEKNGLLKEAFNVQD